ncbi:sigma-70 family RNA polymerase sigma factor [Amycolatopsis pigmentata]|uniref:Sigma-70 family RNA polymerase sigma factor n=1 Tax=Amycolatopsis pigmentata TaxID=450801 RepID=A0ABW5G432_9PSEU
MSAEPAGIDDQSDADLIASVRAGNLTAYGTLYERHSTAAGNLARQLARSRAEADDLVSEAFAKVLDAIRAGKGPDAAFRAYLLTTLRHTAYAKAKQDKRIDLSDDMAALGGAVETLRVPFADPALAGLERTLAAKAFARLPERWQAVLWHTEVERQGPSEVAPLLGLSANGVSALAHRAREGLRQAYLQVHLNQISAERCRAVADRLGAWTRDGLSKRERAQVEKHLDDCDSCRALAAELADINTALRTVLAPLVLGGAASAYLKSTATTSGMASSASMPPSASTPSASTPSANEPAASTPAAGGSGASGSGASAVMSGPRQFVGLAVSGIAIAAAVATALATGGPATVPEAGQQPAPSPGPELPTPAVPPAVPSVLPPVGSPVPGLPVPGTPITEFPPPNIPLPGLVVPGSTSPGVQPSSPGPGTTPSGPSTPGSPGAPAPGGSQPPGSPAPGGTTPPGSPEPPGTTPPGSPEPPGTTPPGSPQPPGTTPPGTTPPGSPPGQPAPRPPRLVAIGPLRLDIQAAGVSVRLALTIRNDGGTTSAAVAAKLTLPPGIHAIAPGCPVGRDTVTCGIDHGLRPGEAAVLALRLVADPGTRDGRLTGTVTADGVAHALVDLPVSVGHAPPVTETPSDPPATPSAPPETSSEKTSAPR